MGSCRYFFCLMHVGTRYQHYQRGTPDTFSRLRNFSGSHDLDYQRLPACHCHLFAFILVTGRNLWVPQNISFGNSYVHRHFPDLRFVPFILDIDHCPHFPGIQCFGHYQRQHGLVALTLGLKYLPRKEERSNRKFDKLSAIANAITFGLLIYTLDGFAHHENNDYIVIQLAVLAVVGTYYVRRQLNQPSPLLPLDLLGIPIFRLSILTSICSFTAQMLAMVSLPFFLQNSLGYSEVMTGLLLTPWPIATLVTAPAAGYLVERIHPGILGSIGMALFCIGLYSLSTLTADSSVTGIILRLMLCGAGFGLFQTPNNSTIISSAPTRRSGGASGMLGMARLLGQTFGTTLVALLFSFVVHEKSTAVCLIAGSGFAFVAAVVSSMRLSQPSTLKTKPR